MKKIFFILTLALLFGCQTKYQYIDTGLANGIHDCSMYDYFLKDTHNWDSTRLMIDRGGLSDLFKGKDPNFKQITFLGPTNLSIMKWMLAAKPRYNAIAEIPEEDCREFILRHVLNRRVLREEVKRGDEKDIPKGQIVGNGGEEWTMSGKNGHQIWAYSFKGVNQGVPDAGPISLTLKSITFKKKLPKIASGDIQTNNGVVHSLHYSYSFPEI